MLLIISIQDIIEEFSWVIPALGIYPGGYMQFIKDVILNIDIKYNDECGEFDPICIMYENMLDNQLQTNTLQHNWTNHYRIFTLARRSLNDSIANYISSYLIGALYKVSGVKQLDYSTFILVLEFNNLNGKK